MRHAALSIPAPIPHRLNEDAYFIADSPDCTALMVADGASPRFTLTQIAPLFAEYGDGISSASLASRTVLDACKRDPFGDPRALLLEANDMLTAKLERIYGDLSTAAIAAREPELADLFAQDARLLRLALPVAVATLARIDKAARRLTFAHSGDCALFLFRRDGSVEMVTNDQMGQHDEAALAVALEIEQREHHTHLSDVLSDPRVVDANRRNALYHNFVTEAGTTDLSVGVGVVNGLLELEDYI